MFLTAECETSSCFRSTEQRSEVHHDDDDHAASYSSVKAFLFREVRFLNPGDWVLHGHRCHGRELWTRTLLLKKRHQTSSKSDGKSFLFKFRQIRESHLNVLKVRAVPAVRQSRTCPLPVLQEGDGPQRHEDTEEHCSSVIKQQSHLQTQNQLTARVYIKLLQCKNSSEDRTMSHRTL